MTVAPHASFESARDLDRMVEEFAANLRRFLIGEPLHHALRGATLGYGPTTGRRAPHREERP